MRVIFEKEVTPSPGKVLISSLQISWNHFTFHVLCSRRLRDKMVHDICRQVHKQLLLVTELWPTLCDPMDCNLLGSSVHGILQARILEWSALSSSRVSPLLRGWTRVSHIVGRFFTIWATRETQKKVTEEDSLQRERAGHPLEKIKENFQGRGVFWRSLEGLEGNQNKGDSPDQKGIVSNDPDQQRQM